MGEKVTVKTLMEDPSNRHYFGLNRPEQTGEAESHGFRTSAHADTTSTIGTLDPSGLGAVYLATCNTSTVSW